MKKSVKFLRSMRFGLLLLGAIVALSVIGTLITQGQDIAYYESVYRSFGRIILFCGFDHVYTTWYYIMLFAALCVNLLLCSVLRFEKVRHAKKNLLERARHAEIQSQLNAADVEAVGKKLGFRPVGDGFLIRHAMGLLGSLVTHIGILLLVLGAAIAFSSATQQESFVLINDSLTLADGCRITVSGFSMKNDQEQLDYLSTVSLLTLQNDSAVLTASVNHPARYADHIIYQKSYRYAGVLEVQTAGDSAAERVLLVGEAFLSLDGIEGIRYVALYGDYTESDDGQKMPLFCEDMKAPAYVVQCITRSGRETAVLLPDETVEIGGVWYTFRVPEPYPGLLIKTQPVWVMPLLYLSFAILTIGLYLCFFHIPEVMYCIEGKVRIVSSKDGTDIVRTLTEKTKERTEDKS